MADDVKELRVKIDMSYHLKLHALKLLRNKKMSEAVEEALDRYFADVVKLDEREGERRRADAPAGSAESGTSS